MAQPLSPLPASGLNVKTPMTTQRNSQRQPGMAFDASNPIPSKPDFTVEDVENVENVENDIDHDGITFSPFKNSPFKQERASPAKAGHPSNNKLTLPTKACPSPAPLFPLREMQSANLSPRRIVPTELQSPTLRRSPSKADQGLIRLKLSFDKPAAHDSTAEATLVQPRSTTPPLDEPTLRDNEGLTKVMDEFSHPAGVPSDDDFVEAVEVQEEEMGQDDVTLGDGSVFGGGFDDTANFSTFSAVHNADTTLFPGIGGSHDADPITSPAKQLRLEAIARYNESSPRLMDNGLVQTPRRDLMSVTPGTAYRTAHGLPPSASPTPRRKRDNIPDNDTTNLILDFTEQFNALSSFSSSFSYASPGKRGRGSPHKYTTHPDLAGLTEHGTSYSPTKHERGQPMTPSRQSQLRLANLLDFDIPPAPTPRSLPTISARELESLKSDFLSQISSLKATLSGKEAEVNSLKEAVGDAERRVGEAQEQVREERGSKEALQADREGWEKRGKEMETVLRSVKDEIIRGEREKEQVTEKLEESERKREDAEMKVQELEGRMASMTMSDAPSASGNGTVGDENERIRTAVEKVARDLHNMYKGKHETKVAALKKSYEARWMKTVKGLESKVDELNKENEELRLGRDATLSGVLPGVLAGAIDPQLTKEAIQEREREKAEEASRAEEAKAKILGLTEEIASIKRDSDHLIRQLELERMEKGDLVGAVEEMLSIQAAANQGDVEAAERGVENLRGSIRGVSGMRPPGFGMPAPGGAGLPSGESRIGRVGLGIGAAGLQSRSRSGGQSAGAGRSGIMSNIERMGKGIARVE